MADLGNADWIASIGRPKAAHNGFIYTFKKLSKRDHSIKFYTCEKWQTAHCKGRIHIAGNAVVKAVNEHNHAPDGTQKRRYEVLQEVRQQAAAAPALSTAAVIAQATRTVPDAVAVNLPSMSTFRRLYREHEMTRRVFRGSLPH